MHFVNKWNWFENLDVNYDVYFLDERGRAFWVVQDSSFRPLVTDYEWVNELQRKKYGAKFENFD